MQRRNRTIRRALLCGGLAAALLAFTACDTAEADVSSAEGASQANATPPDPLVLPECAMIEQQKGCQGSCADPQQPPPPPPGACQPPAGATASGAMPPQPPDPMVFIFDADDSGTLDASEKATLLSDMTERCKNHKALVLKRFDSDKDGALSEAEKTAARQTLKQEVDALVQKLLAAYDTDEDGCLSPEEMKPVMEQQKQTLGQKFDADKDGKLSSTELGALRAFLRQQFRSGLPPGQPV